MSPSLRARLLKGLIRVSGIGGTMTRAARGGRSDPHGGGIAACVRRPPAGTRVEAVDAGGSPAALVSPLEGQGDGVIYYLHGGGYVTGAMTTYRALLSRLVIATGARALWLDYRLAPECPFPAAVEDAVAGYRWLLDRGFEPKRVVVAGDSAGGGLSAATLVALRDRGLPLPAGALLLSPWTDLTGESETAVSRAAADPMLSGNGIAAAGRVYLGAADPRDPLASPLFADLHGLPPLMIQVGDAEILLDDSRKLAERARSAKVEASLHVWAGLFHVFPIFTTLLPEARAAVAEMIGFIESRLSLRPADSVDRQAR